MVDAPSISGRHYHVQFQDITHVISVSYEPGDEALFIMLREREGDRLSDIDDRLKSPRLGDLNRLYMHAITVEDRERSKVLFDSIMVHDKAEQLLVKSAQELYLVLPRHLAQGDQIKCQCNTITELRGSMAQSCIQNHLKKVHVDAIDWITEYVCPITGRRWIKDYPHGELQGGGEPRLRIVPRT
jgi:hypothetical protein